MIKATYDDAVGIVHATTATRIELLEVNIPGKSEDIIEISPIDETANGFPKKTPANAANNLDVYKTQLVSFFKTKHKFDDHFPGKKISAYSGLETDIAELESYVDNAGAGNIVAGNIKKTIYNFTRDDGTNYTTIVTDIRKQINLLKEFKI